MSKFLVLAALFGATAASFEEWSARHARRYSSDGERARRAAVYSQNAATAELHNAAYARGETSYALTTTGPFADMTFAEFKAAYLMGAPQNCSATHKSSGAVPKAAQVRPESVDWRSKNRVTPIKDQQSCGSCWTFSTSGCLEAHYCIQKDKDCSTWTGLAEQQLVDCAQAFNNNGCSGGLPSQAYEYIKYNGGIDTEDSYPYEGSDAKCRFNPDTVGAQVKDVFNITSGNEDQIVDAVANVGPVSIAYQVAGDFHLYSHGVYDSYDAKTGKPVCGDRPEDVNHAVVVVGYDRTTDAEAKPYYIVRNSWGTSWGLSGYFWMVREKNMCGLSDCASYPIVA